jgi:CBS domain containing-hemolysin-like protein
MGDGLKIGFALLLIAINGFFVTAEFALVRVRPTRLEALKRKGSRRAAAALELHRGLTQTLATTQVGITLASLGIGWVGEPAIASILERLLGEWTPRAYLRPLAFGIGFIVITLITVILGELVPKAFGIQRAETVILAAAAPLRMLRISLWPMVAFTNAAALAVMRMLGIPVGFGEESAHSEEELRTILSRSHDRGQISRVGRDILERVLGFSRLTARQLMIPRPDVVWLSSTRTPAENFERARASGYTRFPYCDGDLDRVLGIVHIKDLAVGAPDVNPASVMRPPVIVPETATADGLLRRFQRRRLHMAIVVDEYGGTSGVVTLEDVLEEIVGDVQDEFDQEPPEIAPLGEDHYRIAGSARFEEVARALHSHGPPEAEVDTIAGYVQDQLGRVARVGDTVRLAAYELRVEEVARNRIVLLTASPVAGAPAGDGTPAG